MKTVYITEELHPKAMDVLAEFAEIYLASDNTAATQAREIKGKDAMVSRGVRLYDEVVEAGTDLKVITRHATGLEVVNIPLCTRKGILVCNCPGSNSNAVSEHVVTLMLALSKKLIPITVSYKNGDFLRQRESLSRLKIENGLCRH